MKILKLSTITILLIGLILNPLVVYAKVDRSHDRGDARNVNRAVTKHYKKKVIVAPRHRSFRNVVVFRPHGHVYIGYGIYYNDYDAWRWLAFTAITLKILDNINEEAQRKHENAQVSATTAQVGEKIVWHDNDSSGYVMTTKEGTSTDGPSCREFQQEITIGDETEQAYGTACLQADGAWKIVSDNEA